METLEPGSEWLEADGFGGFASGMAGGLRTRRYHALLLTATAPPSGRMVLVNGIEAWLMGNGVNLPLTRQFYVPGVAVPADAPAVRRFSHWPWPKFVYELPGGGVVEHEVFVARDECETVLRWRCSGVDPQWQLQVRPLLSGRDYHALHHENPGFDFTAQIKYGNVTWRPYPGVPAISASSNGSYVHDPEWYRNFLYTQERDRGLDDVEDLAAPGVFSFSVNSEAVLILRAGDPSGATAARRAEALAAKEQTRRQGLGPSGAAAASYLVAREGGGTVLAGFPWFTDWGRDSFIALRGLAIVPKHLKQAEAVLLQWAGLVNEGMLPNRFPDQGSAPEYNAVDASLWFIIAVHDFLEAAPVAPAAAARLGVAVQAILDGYVAGTRYGIGVDEDGLLKAGVPGVQLTWMDAKIGDHVVTPRIGKPVEVQALWINALQIGRCWSQRWAAIEAKARLAFPARFFSPAGGLYDVVDDGHVPGAADASIRPNQIFAVGGLPVQILEGDKAREVVELVAAHLLTPLGLRSLSPQDPAYVPHYRGGPAERDGAYHQGTVWPWLLGGFVQAWLRVYGDGPAQRQAAAERFLAPLLAHSQSYGVGHVPEVADGEAPHAPGGCPFQAWSVGELIRIQAMLQP
jgi:predicted glycogen debranching enzyme